MISFICNQKKPLFYQGIKPIGSSNGFLMSNQKKRGGKVIKKNKSENSVE